MPLHVLYEGLPPLPLCRPLQQAHLYTSIVMARQPVEIVSGGGQQNFAVGLRIKAVLEHTQAKIKALHLFHAGAVALIQAHQHLEHIKVDAQLTDRGARTLALETQQQTGGQVLNEPRLGREIVDLEVKPLHGEKAVAANGAVIHLPQLQCQTLPEKLRPLQPLPFG